MTVSLLAGALIMARTVPVLAEQPKAAATRQNGAAEPDVTELMRTALARYKQNDLEGARQAFQKAWELRQHAAIAASLADVELKLGRYREAAGHLNFYLANLPPGKETMRREAEQQLAECKKHLGSVKVEVDPAEAMVLVDGSAVGEGRQELLVEPGAHSLQAAVAGRLSPKESFSIATGENRQARLIVAPATAAAAQQPAPAQPAPQSSAPPNQPPVQDANSTKFWVALGGGAGVAVGVALGVTFTLKSNSASNHADDLLRRIQSESGPKLVATRGECTATPAPAACADFANARSDSRHARNLAIGSFIGGGVFALATVGALVLWPESKPGAASARLLTLSPSGNWRAPGLVLQGTF